MWPLWFIFNDYLETNGSRSAKIRTEKWQKSILYRLKQSSIHNRLLLLACGVIVAQYQIMTDYWLLILTQLINTWSAKLLFDIVLTLSLLKTLGLVIELWCYFASYCKFNWKRKLFGKQGVLHMRRQAEGGGEGVIGNNLGNLSL